MYILIDSDSDESSNHSDVVDDDDNLPVTSVTWKPAMMSTWKMKNCSIDDTKKGTTFIVNPMLNGCLNTTQEKLQLIG